MIWDRREIRVLVDQMDRGVKMDLMAQRVVKDQGVKWGPRVHRERRATMESPAYPVTQA